MESVRINIWARVIQKLEELHLRCEKFQPEDGRWNPASFDFAWTYLLTVYLNLWHEKANIGYPQTLLILDKRSNHLLPEAYLKHSPEVILRELSCVIEYWNSTDNLEILVATMLDDIFKNVPTVTLISPTQ